MLKDKKIVISLITILTLLLHLVFLYYIKYQNQNMPLSEFNLLTTGNILNFISVSMVILAAIIYAFQDSSKQSAALFITFIISLTVILLLAVASTQINLLDDNSYSFRRPVSEIVTGTLFSVYQVLIIYFAMILWLGILGRNDLIYLRAFVNSIVIVVLIFAFSFYSLQSFKSDESKISDSPHLSNVAVVLGAAVWPENKPSPSLAGRVDKAVQLYEKGIVGKIQLTGSNAPGELSEALVAFNYIKTKNVDETHIWIEDKTTSTNEQIYFIKSSLVPKNKIGKIIVVSDSYHLQRVKEICKFYNIKVEVTASDLVQGFDNLFSSKLKESVAILVFWFFAL